jgi:diacylglycerol kinase family enzyme
MHWYVYEESLNDKKFATELSKIESRLADLEIKGRICRLSVLKNLSEALREAVSQGAETIVAVGSDQCFLQTAVAAAAFPSVTVGFIPMDDNSLFASAFGLPIGDKACDVLAQRLVKKIDLGKVNQNYFVDALSFSGEQVFLEFAGYQISPASSEAVLSVRNLGLTAFASGAQKMASPTDGKLEAVIEPLKKNWLGKMKLSGRPSVFPFRRARIVSKGEPASILADGRTVAKTPAEVTVEPEKLKVIVGPQRLF